jgi:hypothetical protein
MMTFLQNMGTGTRSWLMGPRDIWMDDGGWRVHYRRDDVRGRGAGEEYVEEEWGDVAVKHGGSVEEAGGTERGVDLLGVA